MKLRGPWQTQLQQNSMASQSHSTSPGQYSSDYRASWPRAVEVIRFSYRFCMLGYQRPYFVLVRATTKFPILDPRRSHYHGIPCLIQVNSPKPCLYQVRRH